MLAQQWINQNQPRYERPPMNPWAQPPQNHYPPPHNYVGRKYTLCNTYIISFLQLQELHMTLVINHHHHECQMYHHTVLLHLG